jgi:hypothetical protein
MYRTALEGVVSLNWRGEEGVLLGATVVEGAGVGDPAGEVTRIAS